MNIQHLEFEPPEALRDAIKCFWYEKREFGELPSVLEVLPDGYAEIIFYFGSGLGITCDGIWRSIPSPFIMGLLQYPVFFNANNRLEVIGVRCFPWTVFDLLGLSPGKDGVQIFEHPIGGLQSTLNHWIQLEKIDEAVTLLKGYFLDTQRIAGDNTLLKAGVAMGETNGTLPVKQVAAAAHATVRTLQRKFMQASGYTVKDVSGLMRFEQVRNKLWLYPDSNIAGLAFELGYTDQAHLSREFRRYSGTTPAAFARKAKKGGRLSGIISL